MNPHAPASVLDWLVLLVECGILVGLVRGLMMLGEMRVKINTMWQWWIEHVLKLEKPK